MRFYSKFKQYHSTSSCILVGKKERKRKRTQKRISKYRNINKVKEIQRKGNILLNLEAIADIYNI